MYVSLELGDDNFIGFLRSRKQQPKDNPNGAFGLGVWTIKVANCPSLMILWAWGVPQNNGPMRTGGQGPIISGMLWPKRICMV
jgi:hypothetical protein